MCACTLGVSRLPRKNAPKCAAVPVRGQRSARGAHPDERRHRGHRAERRPRRLSAHAAAQARRDFLARSCAHVHRHPAGQPVLQADGARAQVRRQRNGDCDLRAGQELRQAAGAAARHHDGPFPAGDAALPRRQAGHPRRACRQAGRRALLQPDHRGLGARHPAERLRRRRRSHPLGDAGGRAPCGISRARRRRAGRAREEPA